MLKKTINLILAVMLVVSLGTAAIAAPSYVTRFNPETGAVTLIGEADGYVTVKIADFAITNGAFSDGNLPLVIDKIHADGEFTYTLELPDSTPAGKYTVYLRDADGTKQDYIQVFDAQSATDNIIPALNQAKAENNYDAYEDLIIDSAANLGIDKNDTVYKNKTSYIIKFLYNSIDAFSDAVDFYAEYCKAYAIAAINGAEANAVETILKKHAPDLGFDYNQDYVADAKLSAKAKNSLCTMLSSYDFQQAFSNGMTFLQILNSLKPVASISTASKWQDIQTAMETNYKNEYEFVFKENSSYKSVANMRDVYSNMMNYISSAKSLKDVQKLFDSAVQSAIEAQYEQNSRPSYSGGGGTVVMPKDDAVITPQNPVMTARFSDVASGHWAYDAIMNLSDKNAINGYEDGAFKPNNLITRAEFIKILVSLSGMELSDSNFTDVSKDSWYYKYVGAAEKFGIAKGDNGKFNPDSYITRQDAAVLLYRVIGEVPAEEVSPLGFTDKANIDEYAANAVDTLSAMNVLSGYTTGEFLPQNNMTRAEVAQMLYKAQSSALL